MKCPHHKPPAELEEVGRTANGLKLFGCPKCGRIYIPDIIRKEVD